MSQELPTLDRARLADVVRGSALSAADFLAEFRRATELDAGRLLDAAGAGDLAQVGQIAHRIGGACRMIGAAALARECSAVAATVNSDDAGELRTALDSFIRAKQVLYDFMAAPDPAVARDPRIASDDQERDGLCDGLVFLVVEDHEFQLGMIMRLLRQLGAAEVHGFAGGAAALQAARELPAAGAILVLDLAMPSLNGIDVTRFVGEERLPVTVILNSALGEDLLRWPLQTARSYGTTVLGAVSKPLTQAKLAPLIAQHRHLLAGKAPSALTSR